MNKKVMIVHASAGMGHTSAAKAIRDAFVQKYPDVDVNLQDILSFGGKFYKWISVDGYDFVSSKLPTVWGWIYKIFNNKSRLRGPNLVSNLAINEKFFPYIHKINPDFIITTHPLLTMLIANTPEKDLKDIP